MSTPPNDYVTDAMWQLWLAVDEAIPQVKLGGIYSDKAGYHNTRKRNRQRWPNNYSIQLDLDKLGPDDKAAAIDLTFSDAADMRKYTKRLKDAMLAGDSRLASVKEFYGTLDSESVYGLGKKNRDGEPYKTSADDSHLWHLHISIFRADVSVWAMLKGTYEVLTGKAAPEPSKPSVPSTPSKPDTNQDWTKTLIMALPELEQGSKGTDTKRAQGLLIANGYKDSAIDGVFGPKMKTGTKRFQKNKGLASDGIIGPRTWTKLLGE